MTVLTDKDDLHVLPPMMKKLQSYPFTPAISVDRGILLPEYISISEQKKTVALFFTMKTQKSPMCNMQRALVLIQVNTALPT